MHFLFLLTIVFQIYCLVHAFKRGRESYWIFLIIFAPGIGVTVYFIIEILPNLRRPQFVKSLGVSKKASKRLIKKLSEEVEFCDTVTNELNLADAHLSREEFALAHGIYRDCLSGAYEDDPVIIHKLAESAYGMKNEEDAINYLLRLKELEYDDYKKDREYLLALSYSKTEQIDKAIVILEGMVDTYPGEEVRYALGSLYTQKERFDDAVGCFRTVISNKKRYKNAGVGSQRKWIGLSKKRLKELAA